MRQGGIYHRPVLAESRVQLHRSGYQGGEIVEGGEICGRARPAECGVSQDKNRVHHIAIRSRGSLRDMDNFRRPSDTQGEVHLKTDSRYLYEYSLAMARQNGLEILAEAIDIYGADRERLYASQMSSVCGKDAVDALFEVQTFYEKQYLAQGIPITYLAFRIDKEGPYVSPEWDEDSWER